ncbi:hypothetical protein DY000_02011787 [Brassica cretica]|uniref:Uncharacterized protein n=1 Tax=Brassica cretica TaxID=69181 RepID=A0ABQ7D170_BRACR|nr:hypothetical protein DY000_02011787 [Brassica cretica]
MMHDSSSYDDDSSSDDDDSSSSDDDSSSGGVLICALISLRTGSTIFYTTTFVLGALKTPNISLLAAVLNS